MLTSCEILNPQAKFRLLCQNWKNRGKWIDIGQNCRLKIFGWCLRARTNWAFCRQISVVCSKITLTWRDVMPILGTIRFYLGTRYRGLVAANDPKNNRAAALWLQMFRATLNKANGATYLMNILGKYLNTPLKDLLCYSVIDWWTFNNASEAQRLAEIVIRRRIQAKFYIEDRGKGVKWRRPAK